MYTEKQITRYFNLAKNASQFSGYEKNKIGAILVYKHDIIGVGYNRKQSSPTQKKYNIYRTTKTRKYDVDVMDNYIHAEIDCVQNATRLFKGDLSKCSIFVYREHKDGSMGVSKPCKGCSMYLKDMNVKNIYYTTDNGWNYERREY